MPPSRQNAIVLPSLPQKSLLGLDSLALTPSPRFFGFKDIPSGWHFLYAGAEAWLSVRTGFWIHVPEAAKSTAPWLRVFTWNSSNEVLEPSQNADDWAYWRKRLEEEHPGLMQGLLPYHLDSSTMTARTPTQTRVDFAPLTSHITPDLLAHMTSEAFADLSEVYSFSTSASSLEDRDDIPGVSTAERKFTTSSSGAVLGEEQEIRFLGIDLTRTWRKGAVGRERTEEARDRSGALERVVEAAQAWTDLNQVTMEPDMEPRWGQVVVGEMQVAFLMVLLLANWSCLEEWKRIIALTLTCKRLVVEQPAFFVEFLRILRLQLQRCDDVEGGLFDMSGDGTSFLKKHLRDFCKTVEDLSSSVEENAQRALAEVEPEMRELEEWLRQAWDWTLNGEDVVKRGMVQLEDGEEVEVQLDGFDADDETGEYAPVVVDLV